MKRLLSLFFALLLGLGAAAFAACDKDDPESVEVYAPDGAPALALANLIDENFTVKGFTTEYRVVPAAQIRDKALDAELAIVPSNMAAILYNQTNGEHKIVSVNTFGNLYLVKSAAADEVTSFADLAGKTVYLTGRNGVPDIVFQKLCELSAIEVTIEYRDDGSAIVPLLKAGTAEYAVLGEPAATQSTVAANTSIELDLQAEWKTATGSEYDGYPQACLVVETEFAAEHPDYVRAFVEELQKGPDWLEEHPDKAAAAIVKAGSEFKAAQFSAEVIGRCNIGYASALGRKAEIEAFYNAFTNKQLIGGKIPDENFYCVV